MQESGKDAVGPRELLSEQERAPVLLQQRDSLAEALLAPRPRVVAALLRLQLVEAHAEPLLAGPLEVLGAVLGEDAARDDGQDDGGQGGEAGAGELVRLLRGGVVRGHGGVRGGRVAPLDLRIDGLGVHGEGAVGEPHGRDRVRRLLVGAGRDAHALERGRDVWVFQPLRLILDALVVERKTDYVVALVAAAGRDQGV